MEEQENQLEQAQEQIVEQNVEQEVNTQDVNDVPTTEINEVLEVSEEMEVVSPQELQEALSETEVEIEEPAYAVRMREELSQLVERLTNLEQFLATKEFRALPMAERLDLKAQAKHMNRYRITLTRRVGRL